jgi:hypothetical protein
MSTHRKIRSRAALLPMVAVPALLLSLGGCDTVDPYKREGMWRPNGANALNRELQVARPSDLVQGRGTVTADGDTAARAIDRMRADKIKPLPLMETSSVRVSSGGGS